MNRILFVLLLAGLPAASLSATAPDLRSRIRIDGRADEYTPDEWILDANTDFRESPVDSRWGADNDIHRIAVTWDETYLYIAVEAAAHSTALMTFLEHAPRGAADLVSAGPLRRNVVFSGIAPNLILEADKASLDAVAAVVSILEPFRYLDLDDYESQFFQPPIGLGAMEVALPWSRVFPDVGYLRVLAIITGGVGTGAGDAAPDPTARLHVLREAQSRLDNSITVPVDANRDGLPDMGVSPRSIVSFEFEQEEPVHVSCDAELRLQSKSFSPDIGEVLRFQIGTDCGESVELFVSCFVYSVTGERVRTLFVDERRVFQPGVAPPWDEWDGRNDGGEIVRGGAYIVRATTGQSPGAADSADSESAAVIR
jgi:hypothetical protein